MTDEVEKIKKSLRKKKAPTPQEEAPEIGLSSGCTLLNLACSGRPNVGYLSGHFYHIVGHSSSGKTLAVHAALAEAALSEDFKDYQLILNNPERGALFDIQKFFGSRTAKKLVPHYSETVEDFYFHLDDALDKGPCVYVLDSMDGLNPAVDDERFDKAKESHRKGDASSEAGSYGTAKAKTNSANLNRVMGKLAKTGSILLVISQTRTNIGFTAKFSPDVVSGGKALQFYCTLQLWWSVKEKIKKRARGKERQIGITSKVQIKKNRQTGRENTIEVPIYWSFGIDDTGSCVDYLLDEGHWELKKEGRAEVIEASEFDYKGSLDGLIKKIEDEDALLELRLLVARVWKEIEDECLLERKRRYT